MRTVIDSVRRQPIAVLALFIALGGTSYAAVELPKNSVGAPQIRQAAVTPGKVAPATVKLFKGQKGVPGKPGATNVVVRSSSSGSSADVAEAFIGCAEDERATGGGIDVSAADGGEAVIVSSHPTPADFSSKPSGWAGSARNVAGTGSVEATAYVICATP
jgi:hypothetical protein